MPANAADFSHACGNGCLLYLPLPPPPLHFHSFSHSCQSQGLCKETPNELHGRGTKTQFQFQFRFQFGFCFSVSNLNFNLQKCIGRRSLWLILCVCGWHHNKWTSGGKQRCRCGAAAVATTIALDIDMRQISQQLNCAYAASTAPQLNKFQFISIKNCEAASPLPVSCCSGLDSAWVMRRVACLPSSLFCSILFLLRVAPRATWHWKRASVPQLFLFPATEHIVQLLKCLPDGVVTSTTTIETATELPF